MANGSNNRLRRKSPGDDNLFDNHQNINEQQPVKLGSFLSDKSRYRAESALKNRKVNHGRVNAGKTFRKERKSSILNSLDKFLDDNDTDDDRTADTMSLRSSFSSGLGSETSEKHAVRKSLQPRVETTLEENNDGEDDDGEPRRRYQRRGSVTRYSLKDLKEDLKEAEDEDTGMTRRHSCHGEHKKKKATKLKPSSHHGESNRSAAAPKSRPKLSKGMNSSIDSSMRSIDERPLPMRETSMRSLRPSEDDESIFSNHDAPSTIDARPLPMRMGDSMSSFQSFASDSDHGGVDEDGFYLGGNGGGRPPLLRGGSSSKKTRPPFEPCPSNSATMSSFDTTDDEDDNDDDDDSIVNHQHQQRHHQRKFPPRPQKKNIPSLSGLANLPSSSSKSDDHLQDDRSVASGSTIGGGGRMRRRGSVTKFSLDVAAANAMVAAEHDDDNHHLPPRPRAGAPRQGSARKSLGCMLNKIPGASGSSSRHNDEDLQDDRSISSGMSEGRQRYRRRGSVTKYSLETNNSNQSGDDDEEEDNRSVFSQQLPPRPAPSRRRVSNTRPPPQKTKSLGRMPLARGSHQPQKSKSLCGKSLGAMLSSLPSSSANKEEDDCCDRSINSEGILGGGRQRYRRRGSVTKFSLDDDAASACTNPAA